jgi:sulfite reductase (ferredoxin)
MSESKQVKLSPIEGIKAQSQFLRGDIAEELAGENDHFGKASIQLLKFHGTYEQDDRDFRVQARQEGRKADKRYIYMVRTRIPGGRLTGEQLLAHLDLGDDLGESTLRITSRQGLQLHGIVKEDLQETIRRINAAELTTLGACGDVNRNVMCCPSPSADPVRRQMQELADQITRHLAPRTPAYRELWLKDPDTGEKELVSGGALDGYDVEPIYGARYMPRKFKVGVALPEDNCIDIYTQDLGFLAVHQDGELLGYNVIVGGGMGVTPANKKTFAALGQKLCFVKPEQALAAAEAVVKVQRDFGNRSDRKVARLKYLVRQWGMERFKAEVEKYFGSALADPDPADVQAVDDHMGWAGQGDGRWVYGLNVENGRIKDADKLQLKTALREICKTLSPGIRLTAHQSILLTGIAEADKQRLTDILKRHGVPTTEDTSTVRRWSMACVAWPTCGLSITESERALPGMIDQLEEELTRLGLASEVFTVRMTGCPNGCARPYNSDVGLVGKAKDRYTVLLGGRVQGNRLNFIYKDLVPREQVVSELATVLAYFQQDRQEAESFGDFCARKGKDDLLAWADRHAASEDGAS